jgi:serine/threonine protein kinase
MAIAFSCPHCQKKLKLRKEPPSDKKGRCPRCRGVLPVKLLVEVQLGPAAKMPTSGDSLPESEDKPTQEEQRDDTPQPAAIDDSLRFLAPPQQPDELGRLGPYRVLSRIGAGGMGMVFCAEDPLLKRQVALKVMLPQFASNPRRKARFLREAHAQAAVEHEHVVAIFQVGEHDGVAFIAMPLLKGQTLSSALIHNPQPPLKEVLRIGREMAEGLAAAHEAGLIHRDIKPPNVWLDGKKRRVKILDFGLARVADSSDLEETDDCGPSDASSPSAGTESRFLTVQGSVVGTPGYMSPEQARGESIDQRTDLFSLGIVLYQMVTGRLPFNGSNKLEALDAVINEAPVPPHHLNPNLHGPVSALILHLLAKPVEDRPASAEEVAEKLAELEASLETTPAIAPVLQAADDPWRDLDAEPSTIIATPPPAVRLEPLPISVNPARKRGLVLIAAAIGCVVTGAAGVTVFAFKSKTPEPHETDPVVVKGTPPTRTPAATTKKPFAWPAEALREGRIPLPNLSAARPIRVDEFQNAAQGWPLGRTESKGLVTLRGWRESVYFVRKEFEGGRAAASASTWPNLADFVCQVDGRIVDDPAASWELSLGSESQHKALSVTLSAAGKLTVAVTDGDNHVLESLCSCSHAAISNGAEFNRLTLISTSDRIEVFVNGVAVCDPIAAPARLRPVSLALGLIGGGKCTAEFRSVKAWAAEGLAAPEERLKSHEVPVKDAYRRPFAWPVQALREGRIPAPDFSAERLLKRDDFDASGTAWPVGRSDNKGFIAERGFKDGAYFIQKEFDSGWSYVGSSQFTGLSSFVCEVDGKLLDDAGSTWDLWFGNDQQRKALAIRVSGAGKILVGLWDYDAGYLPTLFAGAHPAIKTGRESNTLSVVYTDERIEIYVNGVAVCDPLSPPLKLQPVRVGLGVSGGGKSGAEFRRLSIWSADQLATPEERLKSGAVPSK